MTLYSPPPPARPFSDDKPTLLVSWWITILSSFIILLRLAGRYIRVEKLLTEDKIAAIALIPLYVRMACVHAILVYGTNNIEVTDEDGTLRFTEDEMHRRSVASGLVLLTRILYPATLWILKYVTLHFFARLIQSTGKKRYYYTLMFMRISLVATFVAVIVSDLAECQPFTKYWQVVPDPGPQCRQGYASLLTVATCNAMTDLLLVIFPVPIIVSSRIPLGRKIFLVLLFSLGLVAVIVSSYRVPQVLGERGYQGTRTMWASVELLVATIVANTMVLGSFIRDTGVKKARFKQGPNSHSSGREQQPRGAGAMRSSSSQQLSVGHHKDTFDEGKHGGRRGSKATVFGLTTTTIKADGGGDLSGDSKVSSGRESEDSLIPRQGTTTLTNNVMKTTRIEVTVEQAVGGDKQELTVPMQIKPASVRGSGRGSTKVLQEGAPLPLPPKDR
ncbi:hypothetical protein B0H66DRAFT_376388 [Apodospora peruviana]|uniref:Rhodopsin domain-containing protein n=1 Tax=Apodospora peruviana TaxID=516989 RepID=A0AAE0M049_9PEZI|nr:hypothetical protein B0H66DRAFT_376388 [Apodospora peruviana]